MDIQKIISLVTKTQGLIKNREMAAHVKEKGLADSNQAVLQIGRAHV